MKRELVQDLVNEGYEYLPALNNPQAMLANVREQLQALNKVTFSEGEWQRFVETLFNKHSDSITDKTHKFTMIISGFCVDDGRIQNIIWSTKKMLSVTNYK